jgi:hypothetical protein
VYPNVHISVISQNSATILERNPAVTLIFCSFEHITNLKREVRLVMSVFLVTVEVKYKVRVITELLCIMQPQLYNKQ